MRLSSNVLRVLAASVLSSALVATSALAGGSYKDEPAAHSQFSWTGFYVGGSAGLVTGNTDAGVEDFGPFVSALTGTDFNMNGASYGVHAGYNRQMGNTVVGIEASYSSADVDGNSSCVVILNCQSSLEWTASLVGRLGYASGNSLFYVKGGVVWGELETDVGIAGFDFLSSSERHTGWTAGLGVEHAISSNLVIRIDYTHIDLGTKTHDLEFTPAPGLFTVPAEVDATFDSLKVGISYKF